MDGAPWHLALDDCFPKIPQYCKQTPDISLPQWSSVTRLRPIELKAWPAAHPGVFLCQCLLVFLIELGQCFGITQGQQHFALDGQRHLGVDPV